MASLTIDSIKDKLSRDELKARRIRETKEMEKQAANDVVANYREYKNMTNQKEDFENTLEKYRNCQREIEELKKTKNDILLAKQQAEFDQEKNRLLNLEKIEDDKQKKIQFEIFMKQKAKEAALLLDYNEREKKQQFEEIHRYETKKKVKEEEKDKAKLVTQIYKDKEREKEEEAAMIDNNPINVLYKMATPFHNNGNQIDYSTTRFHNILVERHEDDLSKLINVNAFEKAKIETEKTATRTKSKEKAVQQFNDKTNDNFKEIIRKNKAKESLDRLNSEFEKIAREKNKNPNKNKKINPNANVANAKEMSKKSEYLLNKMLVQQKGNRNNILNKGNNQPTINDTEDKADDQSIRNFYKDDDANSVQDDDYLNNAINEHNDNIDAMKLKYQYEEPIARDPEPFKEKITKINAVDLESYQKAELADDMIIFHKEPIVSNKRHRHMQSALLNEIESEVTEAKFSVLEALKISKKVIEDEEKEKLNRKDPNKAVKDFYAKLNSSKATNKYTLTNIEEEKKEECISKNEKIPINRDKGRIPSDKKTISKETISTIPREEDSSRNQINKVAIEKEMNVQNKRQLSRGKKKESSPQNKSMEPVESEEQKKEDYKRDETKWKYSKKELYERKKQLLKDKSNLKK